MNKRLSMMIPIHVYGHYLRAHLVYLYIRNTRVASIHTGLNNATEIECLH